MSAVRGTAARRSGGRAVTTNPPIVGFNFASEQGLVRYDLVRSNGKAAKLKPTIAFRNRADQRDIL